MTTTDPETAADWYHRAIFALSFGAGITVGVLGGIWMLALAVVAITVGAIAVKKFVGMTTRKESEQ